MSKVAKQGKTGGKKAKKASYLNAKELGNLSKLNLDAAGIDVGAYEHYCAVPEDRDPSGSVRTFGTTTSELHRLADWLQTCGITTVAMESTGTYWIPLFEILEERGLTVCLVHAQYVAKVPGRKTDVTDSQWLQQLHTYGLVRGCYVAAESIRPLRAFMRQRGEWVQRAADHIRRMQKSLDLMNVQVHHAVSDITGLTGMSIIEAILGGERDPRKLAGRRHRNCQKSEEEIADALAGNFQDHYLFCLKQDYEMYRQCQLRIKECDKHIQTELAELKGDEEGERPANGKRQRKPRKNEPEFDVATYLYQICGCDLTAIEGISSLTALVVISELGTDFQSKWPSAKRFASYLGLCPGNKVTGGKRYSSKSRRVQLRSTQALLMAASTLKNSDTPLGIYYRIMKNKMDAPRAITAVAHRMARIIYAMMTGRSAYDPDKVRAGQEQRKNNRIKSLKARAKKEGLVIMTNEEMENLCENGVLPMVLEQVVS